MRRRTAAVLLCAGLFGVTIYLGLAVIEEARPFWHARAVEDAGLAISISERVEIFEDDVAPPEFSPPDFQDYRDALDRPIFSPRRRPPERMAAAPVEVVDPLQPSLNLQLHGIVLGGEASVALLAVDGKEPLQRLSVGAEIGGWRVDAIDAEGVLLRQGGQTNRLRLDYVDTQQ